MVSIFSPDLGQKQEWPVQVAERTWGTKRRNPSGPEVGHVCRGTLSPAPFCTFP